MYITGEKNYYRPRSKQLKIFLFRSSCQQAASWGKASIIPLHIPPILCLEETVKGQRLSNTKPLELTEEKQGEPAARERITGLPEEDNSHLESFHTFLRIEALKNKLAMTAEDKNTMAPSIPPLLSTSLFFLIEYATP